MFDLEKVVRIRTGETDTTPLRSGEQRMKKLIARLPLPCSRCSQSRAVPVHGQGQSAPKAARPRRRAAKADAEAEPRRKRAGREKKRPRPPPVPNKGDVAWMLTSTALVLMMIVPALALFYGGMVRSKNMLSMLMQVFVVFSMVTVLWCIYGYSLAFTEGNAFFGGFDRLFLNGTFDATRATFAMAATFSKGVVLPGAGVRGVPGDLRGDHLLPDRRRIRRAREVLGGAGVHRPVVHVQLLPDRAHGVVLDGPGRVHRSEVDRRTASEGRPDLADGARSTSRAARWCTSTPASPAWWAPTWWASASATARRRCPHNSR